MRMVFFPSVELHAMISLFDFVNIVFFMTLCQSLFLIMNPNLK